MTPSLVQLTPCCQGVAFPLLAMESNIPFTSGHPQRFPTLVTFVKRTSEQPHDVMSPDDNGSLQIRLPGLANGSMPSGFSSARFRLRNLPTTHFQLRSPSTNGREIAVTLQP